MQLLKKWAISLLEKNPYGYLLGLSIMESSTFFLPHEKDFYAMPLLASPSSPGLFLDIGANRGHSALGFCKLMPAWQAISIEANPLHQPRLEHLKISRKLYDYHIVAADATSKREVTLWTPKYRRFHFHSASAIDINDAKRIIARSYPAHANKFRYIETKTPTLALDDLMLAPQIIKIDIQGKELDCLRGLNKTLTACRPFLLVECDVLGKNIIHYLKQIDYQAYFYDSKTNQLIAVHTELDFSQDRNLFFIPCEKIKLRHSSTC